MYLETISESNAAGSVARIYSLERARLGFVMQGTLAFSARSDMLLPIARLRQQLRDGFTLGSVNFRLISLIAAKHVPSSHCSHVFFSLLAADLGRDMVLAVHRDFRAAGLTSAQVEMLAYAEQVAIDASRISMFDIGRLRAEGFSDRNIADIALAASFRSFVGRYFDAVGANADAAFLDPNPAIRSELTVGRAL